MCGPGCRGSFARGQHRLSTCIGVTDTQGVTHIDVGLMLLPHKMPHTQVVQCDICFSLRACMRTSHVGRLFLAISLRLWARRLGVACLVHVHVCSFQYFFSLIEVLYRIHALACSRHSRCGPTVVQGANHAAIEMSSSHQVWSHFWTRLAQHMSLPE